jgi:hypothetical protein
MYIHVGSSKATSTITSYITAIKHLHRENKINLSDEIKRFFKDFTDGYKRVIAKKRERGVMKHKEGKIPVSYLILMELSKKALHVATYRSSFSSFVHTYMLLCWNLFARSCSISDLRTHHFSWDNDSLVIDMSRQKSDQSGEKITPKHLYANPFKPSSCIILSLALHIFSITFREDNDNNSLIFTGIIFLNKFFYLFINLCRIPLRCFFEMVIRDHGYF